MAHFAWQHRVDRARFLRSQNMAVGDILGVYEQIANFQATVYAELAKGSSGTILGDWISATPVDRAKCRERFRQFLTMLRGVGADVLAKAANEVERQSAADQVAFLNECWQPSAMPRAGSSPQSLLARAFLQPYAEWTGENLERKPQPSIGSDCPACHRRPGVAVLRPMGEGGKRSLICSFCLLEWEYRRIVCAGCGEEDHRKLPVFLAEAPFEHVRLECCDTCNQYVKAVDMTKNGLADPVVDEIAALPLDLWAQERGYSKLALNVMGL